METCKRQESLSRKGMGGGDYVMVAQSPAAHWLLSAPYSTGELHSSAGRAGESQACPAGLRTGTHTSSTASQPP